MVGRSSAEHAQNKALIAAERKAEELRADSPIAMHAVAADLRRDAAEMRDGNDRTFMIRLAAEYERQADDALRGKSGR